MDRTRLRKVIKNISLILVQECLDVLEEEMTRKKKLWARKWILRRPTFGASASIIRELYTEDPTEYKSCLRLSPDNFDILLGLVTPLIQRSNTFMRDALPARTKLAVTLTYLTTGSSYRTLQQIFRVSKAAISVLIPEVCDAISDCLKDYMKVPTTEDDWKKIENGFRNRWNFPGCYGAIDGKHVMIRQPPNSGSEFYNYKGTNSICLMAIVDHNYCFWYTDIGANGRASDGGVFQKSTIFNALENNILPNGGVIVGDDAFPLKSYLMKPYSRNGLAFDEKIFNYRLSRKNAFGIMASRFRVFEKPMAVNVATVDKIVRTACTLHNWLRITSSRTYLPTGTVDAESNDGELILGTWRAECRGLSGITHFGGNNSSRQAKEKRDRYKHYFANEGAVHWQDRMVH